jgi:DNA-binding LacI/PurR family transcriptional regulator
MRIHDGGATTAMPPGKGSNDRGVTMDEVARAAGVSQATVSRVVNGNPRVNSDAKRQVERAIERLGFVPNVAARTLVTRRSDSIGVVITEPATRVFGDPFFAQVLRGVSAALTARRQKLVLFLPQDPGEEHDLEPYLMAGHVDGVIMYSLHGEDPLPAQLHRRGVPVVVGGLPPVGATVSYVDNDNRGGALQATSHLVGIGRRRIGTITGPLDMPAANDRLAGYHEALRIAGLPSDPTLEVEGAFTQESGVDAMRRLLASAPDLDGVFVASDLMAAGALQVLQEAGRRVPEDVALIGFDDAPIATTTRPTLSSVRQSLDAMGRELVNVLLASIEHRDQVARKVVLATELIVRESSGGPPTEDA